MAHAPDIATWIATPQINVIDHPANISSNKFEAVGQSPPIERINTISI
jgi:hypothetical protein